MRRKLFDWHLSLGSFAAVLMLVWGVSGAAMLMDPIVRRGVEGKLPKLPAAELRAADYSYPVSKLPIDGAAAVTLRRLAGRAWYEARLPKGEVLAFDGRTGARVPAESSESDIRESLSSSLAGSPWSFQSASRIEAADDHYKSGEFPVYRVRLQGPGGVELYVSARDAALLKTTTRWSRFFRWIGMGVHTWNLAAFKRAADDVRRWSLALFVALPITVLGLVSFVLFHLRRRAEGSSSAAQARPLTDHAKRLAATLTVLSLVLASPGNGAAAALGRIAVAGAHAPVVPILAVPQQPLAPRLATGPDLTPGLAPTIDLRSSPSFAVGASPAPVAVAATPVLPPAAVLAAKPISAARVGPVSAAHAAPLSARTLLNPGDESRAAIVSAPAETGVEASYSAASKPFDGGLSRAGSAADAVPVRPSAASSTPLPAYIGGGPDEPGATPPAPPQGPDRKGLWGLYVTHGAHLLTMSAAWRVAWPLLALDLAGKAGLAFIGSASALVEMGTGLVAGMIVDRLLPRRSMAGAAVARAVISLTLVGAMSVGSAGMPFLFGAFLAHSFALTAIHIGQSTVAPEVAGSEPGALRRLNAVLKIITAAVSIPGALAGGWLVGAIGAPGALIAYAAANALVLAPLYAWLLPKPLAAPARPIKTEDAKPADRTGIWAAAKLIFTNRLLVGALIAMAAGVMLAEPLKSTTLPILARDLAPATAAMMLGGFQAAFYAGQFAGNLGLLKWGERLSNRTWILLGTAGLAAFWLFTLAPVHVGFAFAATALIGLLTQPISVVAKTVFQEEVRRIKPELLGRAMGVNNMVYRLTVSAGTALVGWAAVSAALGAAGTLAAAYTGVGLILVAAVAWLMRPARAAKIGPSPAAGHARKIVLGAAALLASAAGVIGVAMLPFSPLQWHMTLGMLTGPLVLWMATTGAVTILGPLLKKKLDPKLPEAPHAEGFGAFTVTLADAERSLSAARPDFRPVLAQARRAAGRVWYEFEDAAGALAAVDGRDGRAIEPLITPTEAKAAAQRWLAGSRWSIAGDPELLAAYDEQYRKGELPAYRLPLTGPGRYDVYLSARDGRPVEALSRLARVLRWAGIGLHTFGFGLLKSRYDSVRRVAMPLLIAGPIILTVILAIVSRL